MATTFFTLVTRPFSDIGSANFLKIVLYKTTSPSAVYTSQTADDPGPTDTIEWAFPGLESANYICKMFEVTADDDVVRQLDDEFTFIPTSTRFDYKQPILIKIGTTEIPGNEPTVFPADVASVVVPDWIGWTPVFWQPGVGPLKEGIDYEYDITTGTWSIPGGGTFIDETYYFVTFEPVIVKDESVSQYLTPFTEVLVITTTTTLTADDIGKKILVRPTGSYLEITLPDISTVVENRIAYFEFCQGNLRCCKIKTFSGDIVDWYKKGSDDRIALYGCRNGFLELYKNVVDEDTSVWRVHNASNDFYTVGHRIAEDQVNANVVNKVSLFFSDATGISSEDFARLYNEYVLNLPAAQVCTYANWSVGNNKYLYSLKDSGTGKFHVPDLRDKFLRVTDGSRIAGDFQDHAVQQHRHLLAKNSDSEGLLTKLKRLFAKKDNGQTNGYILAGGDSEPDVLQSGKMVDDNGDALTANIATETRPVNVAENYYVLS